MDRNTVSRFSYSPTVGISRSALPLHFTRKTSFDCGELIPVACLPVLPGDSWKVKTSTVARMQTLKTPMMDDIVLDKYWFFVPSRLLWDHFREFMGENRSSAWIPEVEYTYPQLYSPSGGWQIGTIADHLGVAPLVSNLSVNALPFRGYALICDEWFRSEVVQDPLLINKGDSLVVGTNGTNYIEDVAKGGKPFVCNKFFDLFSACLPSPQRGEAVSLNIVGSDGVLPVHTINRPNDYFDPTHGLAAGAVDYKNKVLGSNPVGYWGNFKTNSADINFPMISEQFNATRLTSQGGFDRVIRVTSEDQDDIKGTNYIQEVYVNGANRTPADLNIATSSTGYEDNYTYATPVNLVAEANKMLQYITVNDLRQAFQVQRFLERSALGGNRYIEAIRAHFGVVSPDARMQRPEYLGGSSLPLNIRQITQTSSTTDVSPLGDVAGMSVTTDNHFDFEKSFTEHGYLYCLVVARYHHTYQQGVPREFLRKSMYDLYWPEFQSLGNMGVYNAELFAQGYDENNDEADVDHEIFGYQEAWYDYRYIPNSVSGMMRSVSQSGLDSWHLADYYTELPTLSADWLKEDKTNVDRVLTVSSAVSNQIFADICVTGTMVRPMPLYSIPGLIDHF